MFTESITRRTFVTLSATALAMGLFGCGKEEDTQGATDAESETTAEQTEATPISGGWEANADVPTSALTTDQQAVFDKAIEEYVGMDLLPVCVLGTQVVAGTNYAYLCLGTPVVPDAESGWYVAVVYENLEGACEITSVEQIDVSEPATADASVPEGLTGGWAVPQLASDDTIIIPEEAASAFAKACENYEGMAFNPVALLATQVVAGTNYRLLCVGEPTVPDANPQLNVVDIYEDLEGGAEISNVSALDLLAYV